jgi:hypothetical protein
MKIINNIDNKNQDILQPIQLKQFINVNSMKTGNLSKPNIEKDGIISVELLARNTYYDLIEVITRFNNKLHYLGKWNDGISW